MNNINIYFITITGIIFAIIPFMKIKKNEKEESYESSKKSPFVFSPIDISLKDDGFHGSDAPRFTEWWYFDAVLNKGYSVQMSVRVLSVIKKRLVFVFQRLDIYKDGHLEKHNKRMYFLRNFDTSSDFPLVKLAGKQVIKGQVDEATGNWIYDLSFEINNASANLRFEGCTKGWKGKNPGGDWWAVILPRAKVSGKIKVKHQEIDVKGIGYHDHNWDVMASAARSNLGWFWGKFNSDNFTLTWATIFKTRFLGQPLLVINKKNSGYINIEPENIQFIAKDIYKEDGKLIPHYFALEAHDKNVSLYVAMNVLGIHHERMMGIMNYWRYHVKCTGSVTVESKEEKIDEIHMAEFLKFG